MQRSCQDDFFEASAEILPGDFSQKSCQGISHRDLFTEINIESSCRDLARRCLIERLNRALIGRSLR